MGAQATPPPCGSAAQPSRSPAARVHGSSTASRGWQAVGSSAMLNGWLMSPSLVCAPKLMGYKRCPCRTVDGTALSLTPSEKCLDVNIDPPGGNACQRHL